MAARLRTLPASRLRKVLRAGCPTRYFYSNFGDRPHCWLRHNVALLPPPFLKEVRGGPFLLPPPSGERRQRFVVGTVPGVHVWARLRLPGLSEDLLPLEGELSRRTEGVIVEDSVVVRGGAAFGLAGMVGAPPPVPLPGGEGGLMEESFAWWLALGCALPWKPEDLLPLEGELSGGRRG